MSQFGDAREAADAAGTAGAPTSVPSRIRHTPKGELSCRQAFAISM